MIALAKRVFERHDPDAIRWRCQYMPALSVFVSEASGHWSGFKAGYAATRDRYYSWLGGVDPSCRGQGVASRLMALQHEWVSAEGYVVVETHVEQANDAMVALNLKHGMKITGFFMKRGQPNYIMQRAFR